MKRLSLALGALLLVSACGGSTPTAAPTAGPTFSQAPQPTAAQCPAVAKARFVWPVEVPADLPQPPAATLGRTTRTKEGLTIVRFSTATSLQQSVLFVVREVQKAGFTLGRGDAEPAEADAPFGRGDVRGIYKMLVRDTCRTDWLVAVSHARPGGGSPILPTASRGPSSAPLPFG
ncbi:MAG: hypothetical protein JWM02_2444 [Frankiales bacterium]|nr:hypothetical protein [Frankiales bacterium]